MARPRTTHALDVWMNGTRVATWSVTAQGVHELRYAVSWIASTSARPLSLSLPLRAPDDAHRGALVEAYFENLLPDSRDIRERVQRRYHLRSTAAFDLLEATGRDCVGAVQLLPEGAEPPDVRTIRGETVSETQIADILRGMTSTVPSGRTGADPFRISIAGAQEKTAFLRHRNKWMLPLGATPTTHIFKLPIGMVGRDGIDLSRSVEIEWLSLRILRALGLPVTDAEMADFDEIRVLVVTRFDRRLAADRKWILRLPQEDMCQVFGVPPARKYEADGGPGMEDIMTLLLGSRLAEEDRKEFFRAQLAFWMLAAPDGHAKNFSILLEAGGRYRLAPLYDVVSAYPFLGKGKGAIAPQSLRMAMAVTGKNRHYEWMRISLRHWQESAKRYGLGEQFDDLLHELLERVPAALTIVEHSIPKRFPADIAHPILDGVRKAAKQLGGTT